MKNFLSVLFVISGLTSIIWAFVFVNNLVKAIKKAISNELNEREILLASISLTVMIINPFIIALLITS